MPSASNRLNLAFPLDRGDLVRNKELQEVRRVGRKGYNRVVVTGSSRPCKDAEARSKLALEDRLLNANRIKTVRPQPLTKE